MTALAAAVAHEVRNPLNALGLTLARLSPTADATGRGAAHADAQSLVCEVDGIVDRFLDVARVPIPEMAETPLGPLLEGVRLEAALGGLEVAVQCEALVALVDGRLLRQALRNLVTNAAQAGANRMDVLVSSGAGTVSVLVSDDGSGVPTDLAPHLFDWFETTRALGTGLGLPMARRAIHAMRGDLVVVALRPATFLITLQGSRS